MINYGNTIESMRTNSIVFPEVLLPLAIACELIGGISILLGFFTWIGAWLLIIFLFPTTLLYHAFWNYTGKEMISELSTFLGHLAIYGGLILLLIYGPGRWSIDAHRHKSESK